jgi:hypothetical protein
LTIQSLKIAASGYERGSDDQLKGEKFRGVVMRGALITIQSSKIAASGYERGSDDQLKGEKFRGVVMRGVPIPIQRSKYAVSCFLKFSTGMPVTKLSYKRPNHPRLM